MLDNFKDREAIKAKIMADKVIMKQIKAMAKRHNRPFSSLDVDTFITECEHFYNALAERRLIIDIKKESWKAIHFRVYSFNIVLAKGELWTYYDLFDILGVKHDKNHNYIVEGSGFCLTRYVIDLVAKKFFHLGMISNANIATRFYDTLII